MIPVDWMIQAAALISTHELNLLFGALSFLWLSLVTAVGVLYKIGANWVAKINAKVEAFPQMIRDALDEHEKRDVERHDQQMTAIRKNAEAYTAPWAAMQEAQATLKDRVGAIEDTDRRPTPSRRKR